MSQKFCHNLRTFMSFQLYILLTSMKHNMRHSAKYLSCSFIETTWWYFARLKKKKKTKKHHKLIVVHHIMRLLKPYHRFVSKRELWNLICNYGKYKKALFDLLDVNAIGSHISPDQSGNRKFNKNSF